MVIDIAKLLVERDADVNLYGSLGDTALMAAADKGRLDMAKFLIDVDADAHLLPLDRFKGAERRAELYGHYVLAEFLQKCRIEAIEGWNKIRIQECDSQDADPGTSRRAEDDSMEEDSDSRRGKRPRII